MAKQRSINVILGELRQARVRGDAEAVSRLELEERAWRPKATKPRTAGQKRYASELKRNGWS